MGGLGSSSNRGPVNRHASGDRSSVSYSLDPPAPGGISIENMVGRWILNGDCLEDDVTLGDLCGSLVFGPELEYGDFGGRVYLCGVPARFVL